MKYMDPVIIRQDEVEIPGGPAATSHPDFQVGDNDGGGRRKRKNRRGDMRRGRLRYRGLLSTFSYRLTGGGGGELALASQVTTRLGGEGGKRILIILSKACGLNVKDSVGALTFLKASPKPKDLQDTLKDSTRGSDYCCVTTEDMVRGLDLDLTHVLVVGKVRLDEERSDS